MHQAVVSRTYRDLQMIDTKAVSVCVCECHNQGRCGDSDPEELTSIGEEACLQHGICRWFPTRDSPPRVERRLLNLREIASRAMMISKTLTGYELRLTSWGSLSRRTSLSRYEGRRRIPNPCKEASIMRSPRCALPTHLVRSNTLYL